MAKFQPRVNVWDLSSVERAALQPGQHITAGPDNPGRWAGQTKAGVDVAAWRGNANGNPAGALAYWRDLRAYALAHGAKAINRAALDYTRAVRA